MTVDEWRDLAERWMQDATTFEEALIVARADADRLAPYGKHKNKCVARRGPCICGFDDALAAHDAEIDRRNNPAS